NATERWAGEIKSALEKEKISLERIAREGQDGIRLRIAKAEQRDAAFKLLSDFGVLEASPTADPSEMFLTLKPKESKRLKEYAVRQCLETIRNRVDQFGVSEPQIVPEGERRIVVQLPGIKEPQRAVELIGKTALLEFKLVDERTNDSKVMQEALAGRLPPDTEILYQRTTDAKGNTSSLPYLMQKKTLLTGDSITSAEVQIGRELNEPYVSLEFDRVGAKIFSEITGANVGRRLAIILDNNIYSAPRINEKIPSGKAQITGRFTMEEARDLAIVLRAGALPAPVRVIANVTVGPSLGQDSIRKGLRATLLGAALVVAFMIFYYRLSGVVADFALLLNMVVLIGALSWFRATLTLPGIAGIALTIGMAVDSNVLMFERMREELRLGKTPRSAIDAGYSKAFLTILDSHVTTLITAVVLFQFGTGPIKGFAVSLSLGVLINLYTALVGTKTVFDWMTTRSDMKTLSI
ncbi:MAG: protein translocase subunit SecD, partial [candidate division NC10 bacterium]|nr:protein translocase subunit SecD [candidate division NC10 bacterium]